MQRRDLAQAWYTAMFSRSEKLPALETILPRERGQGHRQTLAEQRIALQTISAQNRIPLRTRS